MAADPRMPFGWWSQSIYEPPLGLGDKGHVYVAGFARYVKIGYSRKARVRVMEVQEGLPENLTLYALIAGTRETERDLHIEFDDLRLRGEWFKHIGKLARWIKLGCPELERPESQKESQAPLSSRTLGGMK